MDRCGDRAGGLGSSEGSFVWESALVDGRGVPWFLVLGTRSPREVEDLDSAAGSKPRLGVGPPSIHRVS